MRDQHGRQYDAELDKDTLMPVGLPTPRGFRQPVPTPSKYLNPVKDRVGELYIDYDSWKRDLLAAEQARTIRLRQLAEKSYGSAAPKMLEDPPGDLLYKLGHGPVPIEFVLAMESGQSKWALGLRRADGSFYPTPKWATDELMRRKNLALSQAWNSTGPDAGLPVARDGEFADDEGDETVDNGPTFTFSDEEEEVEVPIAVGARGFEAVIAAPVKRSPGRPRKNPVG